MNTARFSQPVRATDNSPPFQRWVRGRRLSSPVRDGRNRGQCQGQRLRGHLPCGGVFLTSTLLHRGVSEDVEPAKRFNGLFPAWETAEGVGRLSVPANPQLKQRVNEKAHCAARLGNGVSDPSVPASRSSLRDSAGFRAAHPALKHWVIVCRPDGLGGAAFALHTQADAPRGVPVRPAWEWMLEKAIRN